MPTSSSSGVPQIVLLLILLLCLSCSENVEDDDALAVRANGSHEQTEPPAAAEELTRRVRQATDAARDPDVDASHGTAKTTSPTAPGPDRDLALQRETRPDDPVLDVAQTDREDLTSGTAGAVEAHDAGPPEPRPEGSRDQSANGSPAGFTTALRQPSPVGGDSGAVERTAAAADMPDEPEIEIPDLQTDFANPTEVVDQTDPPEPGETGLVQVFAVPGTIIVAQGVDVIVVARGIAPVHGLVFHLEFDSSVLGYEGSTEGRFMAADGHPTVFMTAPTTANDRVVVGLARIGAADGMEGSGELCRFRFTGIKTGDARLAISNASATSPDGRLLPVKFRVTGLLVR